MDETWEAYRVTQANRTGKDAVREQQQRDTSNGTFESVHTAYGIS